MGFKRYEDRKLILNSSELLAEKLQQKNLNGIKHYLSPNFKFPTYDEQINIVTKTETWKMGDRLSKYAEKYYLNPELWWVIAMFNKKPTDAHFKIGDQFYVPINLDILFENIMKV